MENSPVVNGQIYPKNLYPEYSNWGDEAQFQQGWEWLW
jgi:hypothetical protein